MIIDDAGDGGDVFETDIFIFNIFGQHDQDVRPSGKYDPGICCYSNDTSLFMWHHQFSWQIPWQAYMVYGMSKSN